MELPSAEQPAKGLCKAADDSLLGALFIKSAFALKVLDLEGINIPKLG